MFDRTFFWPRLGIIVAAFFTVGAVCFGLFSWYEARYTDRVVSGVAIGGINLGGLTRTELKQYLHAMNDKLLSDGVLVAYEESNQKRSFTLYPGSISAEAARDFLHIDVDKETEALLRIGKSGNFMARLWGFIRRAEQPVTLEAEFVVAERDQLRSELATQLEDKEKQPVNAGVKVTELAPLTYTRISPEPGSVFRYDDAVSDMIREWSRLRVPEITVKSAVVEPAIKETDVERILLRLPMVFAHGPLNLTWQDPQTKQPLTWVIPVSVIQSWLTVEKQPNGDVFFGLDEKKVLPYLAETVSGGVNVAPENARFQLEQGRVVEFQGSRSGLALNITQTYQTLTTAFADRTLHDAGVAASVPIIVDRIEPQVSTADVNSFGIRDELGTGVSSFAGSPTNRLKNIAAAVKKLNGILIEPGKDFSALAYTGPFTLLGGYSPELVIKGDELKPEIGGGLCQIGTTLFRMAMNSAMPIVERRNHSLVVQYYGDSRNGLPGTDATIYEPAPDFRFTNDTGHYILLQTAMNKKKGELRFTLWGTNDGRKGSYTPPQVKRWIPYGDSKTVETPTLPLGEKKCQHPFRGAEATFTYRRQLPSGVEEDRRFDSYYRPLPEICLVGTGVSPSSTLGDLLVTD